MFIRIAQSFNTISRSIIAFLILDIILITTMLPWNIVVMFTDSFSALSIPMLALVAVVAYTISAPALAAAFAAYRDSPIMRYGENDDVRLRRNHTYESIAAVADPYWSVEEENRTARPYLRAYVSLFGRSLITSLMFGAILAVLVEALCLALSSPNGSVVAAVLMALSAITVVAHMTALNLIVEFPNAHYPAILRNGFLLTAAKWPFALLAMIVLAVYMGMMLHWPWFMLLFGTGLVFFFLYHCVEHITRHVVEQMIAEES
ncbi:hypothetical protein [Bifidobacterium tissieri]|uniref:DUF624 domain-containing protein n=1 Tax=Bifidobacterium tissieri TaxID=1630162 RepID=A0A5M9ZRF8_9BIFI|nr:hypothetical protein [Bifidobacterium tissieri]KAA8830241.1 hypothetical protein EMO89_06195 [Bifidobacterium tissieri]KAA8833039.1 hypothetical protein EM849_02115 [Bifidobacterium tissieri]